MDNVTYVFRVLARVEEDGKRYVIIHKVNHQEPAEIMEIGLRNDGTELLTEVMNPEVIDRVRTLYELELAAKSI